MNLDGPAVWIGIAAVAGVVLWLKGYLPPAGRPADSAALGRQFADAVLRESQAEFRADLARRAAESIKAAAGPPHAPPPGGPAA